MNREIPGFYYDPEKKKYFRIQANHAAPPGSQYSREAVKRKREDHERQQKKAHLATRASTERIRKAAVLSHPLIGAEREIGARRFTRDVMLERQGQVYANQAQRRGLCRVNQEHMGDFHVWHFLLNKRNRSLVAAGYSNVNGLASAYVYYPGPNGQSSAWRLFNEPYRISSTSLSHTGHNLWTMDSGPTGDAYLMVHTLPDRYPSSMNHPISRINTPQSLWSSAPCPTGERPLFAVGGSNGLHTLQANDGNWSLVKQPFPRREASRKQRRRFMDSAHSVVNSVEWMSSNVVASGLADSAVNLTDLRSGGTATRLQHGHSVGKIRRVDPYRLVVSGFGMLRMYDLRYPSNGLQHNPKPVSSRHTSTKPYLSFADNPSHSMLDFDISRDLNLLATATENRKIQLFSLRTGQLLSSPLPSRSRSRPHPRSRSLPARSMASASASASSPSPRLSDFVYPSSISCVQFQDSGFVGFGDDFGHGEYYASRSSAVASMSPKLFVAAGDVVHQWSW